MPMQAPTAEQISQDLRQAIAAEIPGTDPWIWPNTIYVTLKVIAQALRAAYLRLQVLHQQAFVSTAEGDYLDVHASDLATSRAPATLAAGAVTVVGAAGYTIPAGTRLIRADGIAYQTIADITIPAEGFIDGDVVAELEGKASNAIPGTPLPLETPVAQVTSVVANANGISGGTDLESDASLRARLLDLKRNPPHGGSPSEYIRWVREKPGVTRVFVQRATPDAGHVTILFMMDDTYIDGVPLAGDIADVVTILDANAPESAQLHVEAPRLLLVDVQISSLVPNTSAVQRSIETELNAMFRRRSEPGSPLADFIFSRAWIEEAISSATGEDSHVLDLPAGDISVGVATDGTPLLAALGTLSFL